MKGEIKLRSITFCYLKQKQFQVVVKGGFYVSSYVFVKVYIHFVALSGLSINYPFLILLREQMRSAKYFLPFIMKITTVVFVINSPYVSQLTECLYRVGFN